MSYTAKVYYVLESDVSYTIKYRTIGFDVTVGDSFKLEMEDFDYNNKHYYVKYAINNGEVYLRDNSDPSIYAYSMVISENEAFANWFVFCTEDESEITGDSVVSMEDIASEVFLTIDGSTLSTQGSEYINSIDIMQGCVSDSFASYGSTYSPTINCDMFSCEFTDALISKAYVNDVVNGTMIRAWMVIEGHDYNPIPIGRFAVKENPTYNGETVSFTGNGIMSEYMDIAEIEISALNKYHEEELEKKYVKTGNMDFISYDSDSYFWEFLPEDFLRVTGSPLHIDNWSDILTAIGTYGLQQLMIPVVASSSYDDDTHTYDTEYNSRITWRELLSGIAVLLRGNVIEKNGAFYIKRLPEVQQDGYRPIFDGSMYDSSAIFGNNLMSPSKISVKANNWWPYTSKDQKYTYPIGFGYCEGESTVVLNDSVSSIQNVENYPVTIECPWILFETLNRNTNQGHDWYTFIGNNRAMNWQTGLKTLNRAFVYHKASFETTSWHPLMNVGDIIIVEDHDGVKRYVFVGEMTLHYNGTVYAEITSPCEVSDTNQSSTGGSGSTSYNSGQTAQANGTALGTQCGVLIKDGAITNSKIADSTITGSKIAESTIENSNIKNSTLTGSKFEDGTIENSKIKDSTLTGAKIKDATIGFEKVDTSFINDLTADKAYIENLTAKIGDFGFISADSADLKYATIESLEATDGKIDILTAKAITTDNISASVAELGYLSAESAEITYAKIDFANVKEQVVGSSLIKDGAISDAKISNLSANKITGGTIDASKITVTNLNADNITVGTINGQRIGNKSLSLDKLAEEVPTKEYLDSVQANLQGQIDGAIETFTKTEIPTLNNEPASSWTDNETRKKHIGDVCYVLNPSSSADGYCYRFADMGTSDSPSYEWVLIKDSDVTKALQDIIDINGEITGIKQFDTDISSWKTDTDAELSSLKSRTTTLETDMGSKVESSVFNELKQTVDENSASIMSLSDTVSKKADGSTVETLTNTVNEVKQTADSNSLSISGMQTEISKKADGSTVTELSQRTSNLEQNLDGFKTEVSKTYTTKTEFDNLEIELTTNLLKPTLETTTVNGVTCTNNGDGTYTLNGTNSTSDFITLIIDINLKLSNGLYKIIGNSSTNQGCRIAVNLTSGYWILSDSDNPIFNGSDYVKTAISVIPNASINNVVLKPMITTNLNATYDDFVPYTGSTGSLNGDLANNHKLTETVKTIAEQTADKFSWLVKSGTSATNFELTDRTANLVANYINLNGLVTFSGLGSDAQNKINSAESTANNALSTVDNLEIGGRNLWAWTNASAGHESNGGVDGTLPHCTMRKHISVTPGEVLCYQIWNPSLINNTGNYTRIAWYDSSDTYISSVELPKLDGQKYHTQLYTAPSNAYYAMLGTMIGPGETMENTSTKTKWEKGNKATDWSPAPEDISVENIYTPNTTTIDGGKITTESITANELDVENIFADEAVLKELFAQNITATGTITGATLKGAHIESTSGSIGGFDIGEDSISSSGTNGSSTFYTGLTNKTLNGDAFGSLTSYWKMSGAGAVYGGYVQISHGGIEAGTISGTTPTYTPSFRVSGDSITIGDIASLEIKNNELIGIFDGTTPTIVTRTLTLNAMSLAGNYDGETTGRIKSVSGYEVLAVIPRTSGATDVCWMNCYFDSSNVVHARLKNTVSGAKNNFKPTVEVLYRLI